MTHACLMKGGGVCEIFFFWKHEAVCPSSGCIYNMLSEKSASKSSFGKKMSGGDLWAARDSAWVNVHQIKKGWVLKTSREREVDLNLWNVIRKCVLWYLTFVPRSLRSVIQRTVYIVLFLTNILAFKLKEFSVSLQA